MKKAAIVALLLTLAPGLAFANPKGVGGHMRPQLFRDRSPKAHVRAGAQPHRSNVPVAQTTR